MKIEKLDFNECAIKYKEYEYALLYMQSEIILDKVIDLKEIDWNECIEARFFSDDGELFLFHNNNQIKGRMITDDHTENKKTKKYKLNSKFKKFGSNLIVEEYIDYDIDGQLFVKYTRLAGIN